MDELDNKLRKAHKRFLDHHDEDRDDLLDRLPPRSTSVGHHRKSWGAIAAVALIALFVWVPLDTDTGYIEKVRRQVTLGDALAPSLAAGFVLLGGGLLLIEKREPYPNGITLANLRHLALLLALIAVAFALMRWTGPTVAALAGEDYRALRETLPWKHLGFIAGSMTLVATPIWVIEGRITARSLLIALAAVLAIILVFDLPFDDRPSAHREGAFGEMGGPWE